MFEAGNPRSHGGAQKAHEKGGVTPAPHRSPEGPDLRPWVGWLLHAQHPALMLHAAAFVALSAPWQTPFGLMASLGGGRRENKQILLSLSGSPCLSVLVWVHLLVARTLLMQSQQQSEAAPWE